MSTLINEETLLSALECNPHVAAGPPPYSSEFLEQPFRTAFLFYRILSEAPAAVPATAKEVLYTRYYWFRVLVELRRAIVGPDAGLDQQAFQLIEGADPEINWQVLQQLDHEARARAAVFIAKQ